MQQFTFTHLGRTYQFSPHHPLDISIPLQPGQAQVNCYYSEAATLAPIRSEGFIGSVAEGGVCNHYRLALSPHGNGTHTEGYGHISADPGASIRNCLEWFTYFAQVVSVKPESKGEDQVITWASLSPHFSDSLPEALVIRTLPNEAEKKVRQYSGTNPPYLETLVGMKLAEHRVQQLLVDLPSVDREKDGGAFATHKAFWKFPEKIRKNCTITELIYVNDSIRDGNYLLNLHVLNLEADASPSRPVLYALTPL